MKKKLPLKTKRLSRSSEKAEELRRTRGRPNDWFTLEVVALGMKKCVSYLAVMIRSVRKILY